jgi:peptidoglycan-N-acetylglucosamine deacetylase
VVLGVVVLAAVLGVAAVVTAATHKGTSSSSDRPGSAQAGAPTAPAVRYHAATERAAHQLGQDARAINAALRYTPFVTAGVGRHRVIALTFDDGPSPYTPQIVRILVRMHVPATFFVVGQQLTDFAAGLRDELGHGLEIGDHTENHAWLVRLSAGAQYGQIHDAAARMQHLGAAFPRLFRPPYGAYNGQTLATLRRMKMFMVLWSIDPGDWRRPGVKAIISGVLGHARPGAIVIMHDGGGDRSQTVAALPAIVNGLRRRGYTLVTVPRLLMLDPPPLHQRLPQLGAA